MAHTALTSAAHRGRSSARQLDRPEDIESVVRLFERVAAGEGWRPGDQLRAHLPNSVMFGIRGDADEFVGGLQLIRADAEGRLPGQTVWPEIGVLDPGGTAHVGVMAIAPEWRGRDGGLFWVLAARMWRYCVLQGVTELRLEATPRTKACYERIGWPLRVIGELREHWGEPCYPCSLSIREVGGALAERGVRSAVYRRIVADMVGAAG